MSGQASEPIEPRRSSRILTKPGEVKPAPKSSKKRASEAKAEGNTTKKAKGHTETVVEPTATTGTGTKEDEEGAEPKAESLPENLQRIDIGDSLPSLTLRNDDDEDVDIAALTADKGLILFLVPKADTPGCTTQACGFRDSYPDFSSSNFEVYCLSADAPKAQNKWKTKKELPYPLLSDPKRALITALGAGEGGKTKRSHFIFEKGGKLVDKKLPVKPADR
ncbi:hypothetical protein HGRIS_014353 [Hohenbuehelia grisea]|uniref:thioredoxin-dependent peroxiredoxin n=1 Tax=Hohenbuehelia grisea TaxID=104357 RepID=A0ABR3JV99_9AGAR